MRISGANIPQVVPNSGKPGTPQSAPAASEHSQISDLLAISTAAGSLASRGDRVQQLRQQFESGNYVQPAAKIVQSIVSGALTRGA
ncbi:MAG TPA: hypothetical protein VHY84_19030 [Bryobacteraceae bacterium]|nr:hypothetical protein [Bryobacteraceae bacterium]